MWLNYGVIWEIINYSRQPQSSVTPLFVVGQHLDWALTPEALRAKHAGSELHTPACTKNVHKTLSLPPSHYFYDLQPLALTFIWPLKTLQHITHFSADLLSFIILLTWETFWGGGCIANFCPNNACKRTSLKFMRLMIKWFLYIPRLLYSPNCFNK